MFETHPTIKEHDKLSNLWVNYIREVMTRGFDGSDDSSSLKELFNVNIDFYPTVDFTHLHPFMNLETQKQYVAKLLTTDINEQLGGSYGKRLQMVYGVNQLDWMIERLVTKQNSKNCCANLLHPPNSDIEVLNGMKRTACLKSIQLLMRENQLHLCAEFRSQNVFNSHGNFRGLHKLHCELLHKLQAHVTYVTLGSLIVTIRAAHIYEKDYEACKQILENLHV